MVKKRRKKARLIIVMVASVIVLLCAGGAGGYALSARNVAKQWEEVIYPGVKVAGMDLGGKNKSEAINILKSSYSGVVTKKKINIGADSKSYTIDYSQLDAGYDVESIVNEAFNYGKNLNLFDKVELIKQGASKEFELTFSYNDVFINKMLTKMEADINKVPVNASVKMVSRGEFKVTPDVKGYKIDKEKLKSEIKSKINGELTGDISIKAPIQELTAAITADKLKTIDTNISTYSTSFVTSIPERINNIELATKAINGTILMPGDSFSFNGTVGQRTRARGYKEAGVIINNQISSDLGGGICQVSSTFYNALLRTELAYSGMKRIAHTLPSTYVPKGLDATVNWDNIDFQFKNTLDYPIYIEGYTENKNLYFNIYSNSVFKKRSYTFSNDIIETIPTSKTTIEDPNLMEGTKEVVKKDYTGYKVKVTKNTIEDGNVIKSEILYTDFYRPVTGEIRIGTKKRIGTSTAQK